MADKPIAGSTSYSTSIVLRSATDSSEMLGKVAADVTASYRRQGGTRQTITLSNLAAIDSAWSSGGIKEDIGGIYRLDLPDAALAAGADHVTVTASCSGSLVFHERIMLPTQSVAGVAAAVWAVGTRTLSSFGTLAADVWTAGGRTLSSFGFSVSLSTSVWDEVAASHGTAGSTGEKLSAAASAGDPWITPIPGSYTAGQAGYILGTNVDAAVTTRAAASALSTMQGNVTTIDTNAAAIKAKTDQLTFSGGKVAAQLLAAGDFAQACADKAWLTTSRTLSSFGTLTTDVATAVWSAANRLLTGFGFTVNLATSVWEESASLHNTAGTTGNKLNAAASAGDPWSTPIPGSYIAGQAGYVLGTLDTGSANITAIKTKTDQLTFTTANRVDASATATVDPSISSDLAAVKAKTDQLVFTTPNVVDAAAVNLTTGALANAILRTALTENYAADGAPFTLEQAVYMLWAAAAAEKAISGTTMTVKKLDGSTTAMTFTLSDPTNPTAITRSG